MPRHRFQKKYPKKRNIDPLFHSRADYEAYVKGCVDQYWKEKEAWRKRQTTPVRLRKTWEEAKTRGWAELPEGCWLQKGSDYIKECRERGTFEEDLPELVELYDNDNLYIVTETDDDAPGLVRDLEHFEQICKDNGWEYEGGDCK